MARIAFLAPLFLGHLNPICALADELIRRGHQATFIHMADGASMLAKRGLDFHAIGETTHPPGFLVEMGRRLGRLNGPFGLRQTVREVAGITDMLCRGLPAALRAIQADMIVCDQVEAAGGLVADHLGLPHVSIASALPINWEPAAPPIFTPFRYDPSPWGVKRNRAGYHASAYFLRPIGEVIQEHAGNWSLGPRRRVDHCLSRQLQIAQLVAGLDVPRERLSPVFHYCGPLRSETEVPAGAILPPRDGRPLAYASLGSLQGARYGVFRKIAKAARETDLQLVLTHAGGLTPAQVSSLPGSPAAYDFLPQHNVLRSASIAILHGGLNTVLDAASHGVPIVVVPIAFEQGAIAMRVERSGFGISLPRWRLTSGGLRNAVRHILEEPTYRTAATRLQAEIREAGGVRRAADLVEKALGSRNPITA